MRQILGLGREASLNYDKPIPCFEGGKCGDDLVDHDPYGMYAGKWQDLFLRSDVV